eukprot:4206-Hanusia_phi.AAC.1
MIAGSLTLTDRVESDGPTVGQPLAAAASHRSEARARPAGRPGGSGRPPSESLCQCGPEPRSD